MSPPSDIILTPPISELSISERGPDPPTLSAAETQEKGLVPNAEDVVPPINEPEAKPARGEGVEEQLSAHEPPPRTLVDCSKI